MAAAAADAEERAERFVGLLPGGGGRPLFVDILQWELGLDQKRKVVVRGQERWGFIIPAELSSTCYTTTEAPVIAHHAKLGGLRLAPKGPAIHGGAPPIKERKGRGVNWFTYRVAFV